MIWFWLTASVVVGLLATAFLFGKQRYPARHDSRVEECNVFVPPGWLRSIGVMGPALVSVGVLVYLYVETSHGLSGTSFAALGSASVIGALLSLAASIDAGRSRIEITADRLRVTSLGRSKEIDLVEIDKVITYFGHVGVRRCDGRVVMLSGYMGWNTKFVEYLILRIELDRLRRDVTERITARHQEARQDWPPKEM